LLGKQNQAMGKLKVALGFYNQIFDFPDNYEGNWLARKQMRVDLLLRKAICILDEGISLNGRVADAMHYLIEYKTAGGNDPKQYFYTGLAIKFYSREFYDYPEFVKFSDALPYFKEYETKETTALLEETKLFLYSAECYHAKMDYKNALLYYLKYNTLKKGKDGLTLFRIIQCYLGLNDFSSAAAYMYSLKDPIFNSVENRYINNYLGSAYNEISESYLKKEDYENALVYSDSTLDFFAKRNDYYVHITTDMEELRARMHYKLERYDEALAEFDKILDRGPGNYEIRYLRGILNNRLGKNQLACSDWSEAKNNFQYKSKSVSKVPLFVTMIQIDSALSTCTPKMLKPIKGYKYYTKYPPSKN
jgi:tetratricopeptide (TPR) repeat protein